MSQASKPGPPERDSVAMLVRLAGKRGGASDDGRRRAREAARATWRGTLQRGRRRRFFTLTGAFAAAAALVLLIASAYFGRRDSGVAPEVAATLVETVLQEAWGQAPGPDGPPRRMLAPDQALVPGTAVTTGDEGRVALRLTTGHSLRLDRQTRVHLLASGDLALEHGSIYISTPRGAAAGPQIEVQTPLGSIREIGTQFEARLTADALRIRLREGAVVLRGGGEEHRVTAGSQIVLGVDGSVAHEVITPFDPEWDWVLALTPRFEIEGQSALGFLEWIARERGLTLMFDDPAVARQAADTTISGRVGRLSIDHALDAVLPTCGLTYRVEGGQLYVADRRAPSDSRR